MTEQPKKRWQFSLGRALVAITLICIAHGVARALYEGNEELAIAVVLTGLASVVGVIVGGKIGANIGAGSIVFGVTCILAAAWDEFVFRLF